MVRKKTHEEFVAEVKALVGDEYTVLSEYISSSTKINMFHKNCGKLYQVTPNKFLIGRRCPKCFGNARKTTQQFKEEVYSLVGDEYEVLGEYVNVMTKIDMIHNKCKESYPVTPNEFLGGTRCPKCFGNTRKTTQQFKEEVYSLVGDEYEVLGEYVNSKTRINLRHKICNKESLATPNDFLRGTRCPKCKVSKGELKIHKWLENNGIYFEVQWPIKYDTRKRPLKLDFYARGIAIEYDGEQHYKPIEVFDGERGFRNTRHRDHIKDKYCADNGIPLIRIPYWEFDNIDAILTQKLLPLLEDRAA